VYLPEREFLRVQNIAARVGCVMAANTVTYLEDADRFGCAPSQLHTAEKAWK